MDLKKIKTSDQPKQMIYIGPNLPGGMLSRFTVFKNGIPAYLGKVLESRPLIKHLIVPVQNLSTALAKTITPGTIEHKAYHGLLERKGE